MINTLSSIILPIIILIIILYGVKKKIDVYDAFIDGTKESFDIILNLFSTLLGMIFSINIFLKSGVLDFIFSSIKPLLENINIPIEIITMGLMRPVSGSSTLAILNNVLESFGPDSFVGHLASVIQGSTDTTLYIIVLYFGSIKIKKTKYALKAGLFADFIGVLASIVIVKLFFG